MSLFRIYSGAVDLPVQCGSTGGAESAAASLQECSLELWTSHSSHHSLSAALPMAGGIHPENREGTCLPCPSAARAGGGGLCPRSGRPAPLGCPGGEDTRVTATHVCPYRFKEHQPGPTHALGKGLCLGLNPVSSWDWCWFAAGAGVLPWLCLAPHGLLLPILDKLLPWPHMDLLQQKMLLLASCFSQG